MTRLIVCLAALLAVLFAAPAGAATTAFTYQGKLTDSAGVAQTGSYDMSFRLYDALTGGSQVGSAVLQTGVCVSGGLFTVSLDFGSDPFTSGSDRWLETTIGATTLSPRVRITPAPTSLFSAAPWVTSGGTVSYSGDVAVGGALDVSRGATVNAPFKVVASNWTVDQEQLSSNDAAICDSWIGQSFTAGVSGSLVGVALKMGTWDGLDLTGTVAIYSGEGISGTPLTTQDIGGDASDQLRTYQLLTPVEVTAGSVYTVAVSSPNGYWFTHSDNPYSGGKQLDLPSYDLVFRTYIDAGTSSPALSIANGSATVGIGVEYPLYPLTFTGEVGNKISLAGNTAGGVYGFGVQGSLLQVITPTVGTSIAFGTGLSGSFTELMRIRGSGDVGIGTSFPSAKLEVVGTTKMTGFQLGTSATSGQVLTTDSSGVGTWQTPTMPSGSVTSAMIVDGAVAAADLASDSAGLVKVTGGTAVVSGSKIGIGVTSPTRRLDIQTQGIADGIRVIGAGSYCPQIQLTNDTASAELGLAASGGQFNTDSSAGDLVIRTASGNKLLLSNGSSASAIAVTGGNVGIGTTSPGYKLHVNGAVAGTSAYVNLSDARLKTNIADIRNALGKVESLRGVTFDWRRDEHPEINFDEGRQIGFIAQEVEKIVPEAVSTSADGTYSMSYTSIVPLLVEAMKQQQKQIEDQQRQIDELRKMLADSVRGK